MIGPPISEHGQPPRFTLRDGRSEDIGALFALHRLAATTAYAHIFPPERYPFPDEPVHAHWRALLAGSDDAREVIVAEADGHIAGVVVATGDTLEHLFVQPEFGGQGLGGDLHDAALRAIRRRGHRRAQRDVLEDNIRARGFYERRGWRQDGRRHKAEFAPHPQVVGYMIELGWRRA
jgi:GNAT superfamily N-acetyltransferase